MFSSSLRGWVAVACVLASAVGCKKNVELAAPDAGATSEPAATVAAAATTADPAAAPVADVDAALPPLDDGPAKKTTTTAAAAKPKAAGDAGAAKKPDPSASIKECADAQRFCSHPAAATDKAMKAACDGAKSVCVQKGGTVK